MYTQKNRKKTRNTRKNVYQTGGNPHDIADRNSILGLAGGGVFAIVMIMLFSGLHANNKFL